MSIIIYTDGACSGNPGPGGWAYVVIDNGEVISSFSGGEQGTTNNRMELTAAIKALEDSNIAHRAVIVTDSRYVSNGFEDGWVEKWKQNGWTNSKGKPVKNKDLWEKLSDLVSEYNITWNWVKGHDGDEFNEMVDQLAVSEINKS